MKKCVILIMKEIQEELNNYSSWTSLYNSISMFIRLFKCNGKEVIDYKEFFKRIKFTLSYKKYNIPGLILDF